MHFYYVNRTVRCLFVLFVCIFRLKNPYLDMIKRKSSTDSDSSAKTARLDNIPDYKYIKLSEIIPDYCDFLYKIINSKNQGTEEINEISPLVTQIDGVTQGIFLPNAFLESVASHFESMGPQNLDETSLGLKKILGKFLSNKSYDFETDDVSRKSSMDSTDFLNRGLLRPGFDSLRVEQPEMTNGDNIEGVCEEYNAVMGMRPQITQSIETSFQMGNSKNNDKNHNTSEDSEMGDGNITRTRRGSLGGQKGIYGSYARKIEAIHRRNEEDIKNIMEATFYKTSNGTDCTPMVNKNPSKPEDKPYVDHSLSTTLNSQPLISTVPNPYNMVSNGLVQAVPVMHPGPLQYFIHVPVAQGPYIPQNDSDKVQNANCGCLPTNPSFTYPPMQFLHISPFVGQSGSISANIKQEDKPSESISPESRNSTLHTSTE